MLLTVRSDQLGLTSQALTRWRHHQSEVELIYTALLLIYRLRKDERLSWPSWLAYSGRFTHIVVTRRLQAEDRTGSVRRPKTGVLPTVLTNRHTLALALQLYKAITSVCSLCSVMYSVPVECYVRAYVYCILSYVNILTCDSKNKIRVLYYVVFEKFNTH